ncbi:MAG: hypothetical protein COA57_11175 [Flavobacteriales bacterium]|nr:MAG: hypothetical protein COA57_11175 [Flavobacteriales bacterium]
MEWYTYLLAIAGGFAAGFINTLAGSGSLITLPILIFLGLPANVANGTNRIGVFFQCLVSVLTFKKAGKLNLSGTGFLILPTIAGALIGALIAVDLNENTMKTLIAVVMALLLIPILRSKKSWIQESSTTKNTNPILLGCVFFIIGIYGGFIQAGIGIFMLSAMVLLAGLDFGKSNVLKNFIVLCYTLPAIFIFIVNNQVDWWLGGLLTIGQATGGWVSARFATKSKNANVWVRRLLIAMILVSVFELFGLREWVFAYLR